MPDSTRENVEEPQTPWKGEDDHGWAPDAPGEGEAKERVTEANRKAFEPDAHETQEASRADGPVDVDPDAPVPESISRRGEDVIEEDGKDPARYDTGYSGAQRPKGSSTMRDSTGVKQDDPVDEEMPDLQTGDQGG